MELHKLKIIHQLVPAEPGGLFFVRLVILSILCFQIKSAKYSYTYRVQGAVKTGNKYNKV